MTDKDKRAPRIVLHAACSPGEMRVAALAADLLTDYAIWREGAPDGLGDLHLGRVVARVPAMAGAFVLIDGAEGFLPDSEGGEGRTEGDILPVRITRSAQGGKGPRLSAKFPGEPPEATGEAPSLIRRGPGALVRFAERHPAAEILVDDPAIAARLRTAFAGRVRVVPRAFDDELEAEIEALGEPHADLPGGLRASIVPTPALVAIDIDSGSATAARGSKSELQFAANRAALPALARQIRLRNLSGAILIDFAGLPVRRRQALGPDLAAALAPDPSGARLAGFTGLGFAEILRQRRDAPLHELLQGPHAAGLAALRQAATRMAGSPATRLSLAAHPAIIAALQADAPALVDLARKATHPLMLRSDPALRPCQWMLNHADPS